MYYRFKNSAKGATWPIIELSLVYCENGTCTPIHSMVGDGYEAFAVDHPVPELPGELMWSLYGWAPGKGVDCFSDIEVNSVDWDRMRHQFAPLEALERALEVLRGLGITELVDERGIDMDVQDQRGPVYVDMAKRLEDMMDNIYGTNDEMGMAIARSVREDEEDDEADPDAECPVCHGPGILMGALGQTSHYRCRDCGNGFYRKA